ncbi:phosphoadenosine phosphosulfate reductase family protein (plasmid) [Paenibacillus sonchi]|uniref:Phosphoadenosine phosphosulfate reductase family protein n=1 Tax=Paenibacillus sonchi TaxID=373687 RepID=A0A974PJ75_9BACL|nr:phosphoadenosine phosphosulfate reductase family protein [Paenibacillus sonchi]QQZ64583.1 phosphoadenosine phosphosulfate reductase family protein [Paenibacillus sonchi]
MEAYSYADNQTTVKVTDQLKRYNASSTLVWDQLARMDFKFHGVVREWSAVFKKDLYYVLHHFLDSDVPREECIAPDSGYSWSQIFNQHSTAGELFKFLEEIDFRIYIPEQAAIDAFIDQSEDLSLQSPKHKFQIYCFSADCSLLIEIYLQNSIVPYGAHDVCIPFPTDRFQLQFDLDIDQIEIVRKTASIVSGESLDLLDNVDPLLIEMTRGLIKKIYDEHSLIGLLHSGGVDSRLTLQLMIEHVIKNPDPSKKIWIITADTLVENPGIQKIIHELQDTLQNNFPWIEFHIVEPDEEETLLVCMIGKAYQCPSSTFRYCVRRLKINPARKFLETTFLQEGSVSTCLVLGSRDSESGNRKRSLKKYFGDDLYGKHPVEDIRTASPIRDWTRQEVVTYLAFNRAPWKKGARNTDLLAFYSGAAGSECPLGAAVVDDNEAIMSCGKNARMGCYLCTLSKDKSLGNLIKEYPEYEKYYQFRSIVKCVAQDIRYGGIFGFQRIGGSVASGIPSKIGKGIGDLTIDCRTILLRTMKTLNIEWRHSEVLTAYQMVLQRENIEGFAVTRRFREAIYALLPIQRNGFNRLLCHPIFDPYGTGVDQFSNQDQEAIQRILNKRNVNLEFINQLT